MRKMIYLLSALILITAGCTSTPPAVEESSAEEKEVKTVEKTVETKIIDVFLVTSEILSSSDGSIDGYKEYKYDQDGKLLEKIEYDSEKKKLNRMENNYNGILSVKTSWFRGENDESGAYIEREFSGDNPVKEISFDIKGVIQSISNYEYDNDGNLLKWTVSSSSNVPMMITEYKYSNGFKTSASFLTPLGVSEGFIEYLWDNGKLKTEKTLNSKNEIERSIEFEYENGNLVKEIHYKKTRIDHTVEYELDENGSPLNKKYYYSSGNLKSIWMYEYISVKKEVQL